MTEGFRYGVQTSTGFALVMFFNFAYAVHSFGCIPSSSYTFSLNRIWIV